VQAQVKGMYRIVTSSPRRRWPDLILLDLHMPTLNLTPPRLSPDIIDLRFR